ncbi:MAG: XRE family transcriptional regulator [Opitutales bacterium]
MSETRSSEEFKMFDFSILRQLRKREGLNIGEVSRRSGVSSAVISKLERNQSQAGLETLYKLSRVFGMSATDLLALTESRLAHRKQAENHVAGGFHFQEIQYANLRCLAGQARAGARVSRPEIHRDDYEICWVLQGRIRFTLPHEIHDLGAGEAIQFDAIFDHVYEAIEDAELLIIHLRKDKRF